MTFGLKPTTLPPKDGLGRCFLIQITSVCLLQVQSPWSKKYIAQGQNSDIGDNSPAHESPFRGLNQQPLDCWHSNIQVLNHHHSQFLVILTNISEPQAHICSNHPTTKNCHLIDMFVYKVVYSTSHHQASCLAQEHSDYQEQNIPQNHKLPLLGFKRMTFDIYNHC